MIRQGQVLFVDDFVDEMQCKVMPDKDLSEIALAQKRPMVKEAVVL